MRSSLRLVSTQATSLCVAAPLRRALKNHLAVKPTDVTLQGYDGYSETPFERVPATAAPVPTSPLPRPPSTQPYRRDLGAYTRNGQDHSRSVMTAPSPRQSPPRVAYFLRNFATFPGHASPASTGR